MTEKRILSVVLPLYGNAVTIGPLVERLATSVRDFELELVAVDDRGPDDAARLLEQRAQALGVRAQVLRHAVNLGQQRSVLDGLAAARGSVTVVMDADLQDPPETVGQLVAEMDRSGADVVFARRRTDRSPALERACSRLLRRTYLWLQGARLPTDIGLFFALSARAREALLADHVNLDVVIGRLARLDLPTAYVAYDRSPRTGRSSYGLASRIRAALQAIFYALLARRR